MSDNLILKDQKQRQLALQPDQSFIVQAPAGSGKTELLIQRFLTLLQYVKTPEEILAITFTKKAANEMRARIIHALKKTFEKIPSSEHEKKTYLLAKQVVARDQLLGWYLIDNPNQLRIQTIDAFSAYLTRQLPILSHFGSQPDIAENPTLLYHTAVQEVLMHVEENHAWSQAIASLLLHLDNDLNKLHDLLVNLLAKRDQWLSYLQLNTDDLAIKKELERQLRHVIADTLQYTQALFPENWVAELMAIASFAADNLDSPRRRPAACPHNGAMPPLPNPLLHVVEERENVFPSKTVWLGFAHLLLTKQFSWRKRLDAQLGFPALNTLKNHEEKLQHQSYRQRFQQLIMQLSDREDIRLALTELFFLPDPSYSPEQWKILQSLLHILKILAAQLRLTFQHHNRIDFIENAQAALIALGNEEAPTDLALSLDYQIKHILIDEFQDTSLTQFQLIEKLIRGWEPHDGRTIFIVGDPMQSIYRFREAEVGLFIRMIKKGIGQLQLTPLILSINFRSAPEIVNWNNHYFQQIFPTFNNMGTGAVCYSTSVTHQHLHHDVAANIEVKGFLGDASDRQAKHIVAIIQSLHKKAPDDSIAILVRSRNHLKAIIPALKKAAIPYQAMDIDPLASRQSIQDLLSLTCALLHPYDRIAWLAILRAPWCGLTLKDLWAIAHDNPHTAIWEQIKKPAVVQRLSPDGQVRLNKLMLVLENKLANRERENLRVFIENTWLLLGGPATLSDYAEIHDMHVYFDILDEFDKSNQPLNIDHLKEKINQIYASTAYHEAKLQIMTIHTAKGLEFDTVIVPHLESKPQSDDKALLLWMECPLMNEQAALLLAPLHATGNNKDIMYEYIHRQQKIKNDYEIERLLYVASTRAKKRLHLLFNAEEKENGQVMTASGSFLAKLWPLLEKQQDAICSREIAIEPANTTTFEKPIIRFTSTWQNPLRETMPNSVLHKKSSGFLLPDTKLQIIGIITHKIFEQIATYGEDWWRLKSHKEQTLFLTHQLKQYGLVSTERTSALDTLFKAINYTLCDERGRWILHPHREAQSEIAVSVCIEGKVENFVIDRTFIDEQGIRWIIDYKTTSSQEDISVFLQSERDKYKDKMQKYAQAFQLLDGRTIHLGLYFPLMPAWDTWEQFK